jgi:hypothetical protein
MQWGQAQTTTLTEQTATPVPGAGHDYIHLLSDTVNPGTGTVSVRISPPMPKGRGLNLPFSFAYDSGSAVQAYSAGPGGITWTTNQGYLADGGWTYTVPRVNITEWNTGMIPQGQTGDYYECWYANGVTFTDPSGGTHSLPVGVGDSKEYAPGYPNYGDYSCGTNDPNPVNGQNVPNSSGTWLDQQGGDGQYFASLSCPSRPCSNPSISISDADGTVYGHFLQFKIRQRQAAAMSTTDYRVSKIEMAISSRSTHNPQMAHSVISIR